MHTISLMLMLAACCPSVDDVRPLLKTLHSVGPHAAGSREAAQAQQQLAAVESRQLPLLLAALDEANPLAANWIRSAIETAFQRSLERGEAMPADAFEQFTLDRRHAPRARRLAYELLLKLDPAASERLLPAMRDDPSVELRRDAVARLIDAAVDLEKQKAARAHIVTAYSSALTAARDLDQIKLVSGKLRSLGETVDLPRHFGLIVAWRVIGPFDNVGGVGFDAEYPPEKGVDFAAAYPGKHGEVRWIDYATSDEYGKVDLNKAFAEEKGVVAYAAAEFQSERQQEVEFRYASFNATKLWLNGRPVAQQKIYHGGCQFDQYAVRATLQPGRNQILLKICQNEQTQEWAREWGFQFRVCDASGGAILSKERQ